MDSDTHELQLCTLFQEAIRVMDSCDINGHFAVL